MSTPPCTGRRSTTPKSRIPLLRVAAFLLALSPAALALGAAPGAATPAEAALAELPVARLASAASLQSGAVPEASISMPQEVLLGEDFHVQLRFRNAGSATGFGPYVELWLPASGEDGATATPCDGLSFLSAEARIGQTSVPLATGPLGLVPVNPANPDPRDRLMSSAGNLACPGVGLTAIETIDPNHPYYAGGSTPELFADIKAMPHQLVILELPQTSVAPESQGQAPISIDVRVHVSELADAAAGLPVTAYARGGFRYGETPANDPIVDPMIEQGVRDFTFSVVSLMQLGLEDPLTGPGSCADGKDNGADGQRDTADPDCDDKRYPGPEDEAATGPNLAGVYPLRYDMSLNIAAGRTLTDIVLQDTVPDGMMITSVASSPPGTVSPPVSTSSPHTNGPLSVSWPSLSGTDAPTDATVTLEFHLREDLLDPTTCANVELMNDVWVDGLFQPVDLRDDEHGVSTGYMLPVPDHLLTAKCLPVQKSVSIEQDLPPTGPSPGDTLRYRIDFQVPDTMAFGNIVVEDHLGDGQRYIPGQGPSLTLTDRHGLAQESFLDGQWLEIEPTDDFCQGIAGGTSLRFDVTQQLMTSGASHPGHLSDGILSGGHAYAPLSSQAGLGRIEFRATIEDSFLDPADQPGTAQVVKHDPLPNCVTIEGERYDLHGQGNLDATGVMAEDDSATILAIPGGPFEKSLVGIERDGLSIPLGPSPLVAPGDVLTFRLSKVLPSGDAEQVRIVDHLPLPVLDAQDPNADGSSSGWTFVTGGPPLQPGEIGFHPSHDLPPGHPNPGGPAPAMCHATWQDPLPGASRVCLDFGDIDDPNNQGRRIDLLFKIRVTSEPFPDGLTYVNGAVETEANSYGEVFAQESAAPFVVGQPALRITKGVVGSTNPHASYQPAPPAPGSVSFAPPLPPGPCPGRFTGPLTSAALQAEPIDSDAHSVDRFDWLTFAIVVENLGSSPGGAFDVQLSDLLPIELRPYNSVCVYDGTGALMPPPTDLSGGLFGAGIELVDPGTTSADPGALDRFDAGSAQNLAIVTFNSRIRPDVDAGCYANEASLLRYASAEGGPDHVAAGFGLQTKDDARACIQPSGPKLVLRTSVPQTMHDNSYNNPVDVTIGEVLRYRLELVIPEGELPAFEIRDALPPGMTFLDDGSASFGLAGSAVDSIQCAVCGANHLPTSGEPISNFPAPDPISASPLPTTSFGCDSDIDVPVFDFGDLENVDNDPDPEHLILEFNALVCNTTDNADSPGTRKKVNVASFHSAGKDVGTSGPAEVSIVEPLLAVEKSVEGTVDLGTNSLSYSIAISNVGSGTAFDIEIADLLPPCLEGLLVASIDLQLDQAWKADATASTADALRVTLEEMAAGGSALITFEVEPFCTQCSELVNEVEVRWTSLLGEKGNATGQPGLNTTGSTTPGDSGDENGERNGDGGIANDYAASASASPCGLICGTKWHDLDGDGQRQSGEDSTHMAWEIEARFQPGGLVVDTQPTNSDDGSYCLGPLLPGDYEIAELAQGGWTQTSPAAPGTYQVALAAGETTSGFDFGNTELLTPGPLPMLLPFTCVEPDCMSGIQAQSLAQSGGMTFTARFYHQLLTGHAQHIRSVPLPMTAANYWLPGLTGPQLDPGVHAVQIGATGRAAALTRADWPSRSSAMMYNNVPPGFDLVVPLVTKQHGGHSATVTVQNTDDASPANVTASLFPLGMSKAWTIAPGRSFTIDLDTDPDFVGLPAGYRGAMRIQSSVPLGVESHGTVAGWPKATYAFEGSPVSDASSLLFAPLFRNDYFGTTDISVANPGPSNVEVTVTYYGADHPGNAPGCQGTSFSHGPVVIITGGTATFDQDGSASGLPSGCFGAARIEASGGEVLAVVRDLDSVERTAGAYTAVSDAQSSMTVSLPLFRRHHTAMQLYTGISAMNTGSAIANVMVEVFDSNGSPYPSCGAACFRSVGPGETAVFWPGDMVKSLPWTQAGGEYGSAILVSDQPIAVIVNDSALVPDIDSAIYNGIKAD